MRGREGEKSSVPEAGAGAGAAGQPAETEPEPGAEPEAGAAEEGLGGGSELKAAGIYLLLALKRCRVRRL